jgi:hypothetical protein
VSRSNAPPLTGGRIRAEHPCPQCGGGVEIEETDRLLSCPYCRVRLYMIPEDGMHHFYLSPRGATGKNDPAALEKIIFVPYRRSRGPVFTCVPDQIDSTVIDLTHPAVEWRGLPRSLGVRPQACRLSFALPETPGRFLKPLYPSAAFQIPLDEDDDEVPIYERQALAVTSSIVYLPLREGPDDGLVDALAGEPVTARPDSIGAVGAGTWHPPRIRFLPTLCPECGWDMAAARDSQILLCSNCRTAWMANGDRLARTDCSIVGADWTPDLHLPFWRMRVRVTGCRLQSYADLAMIANLPVAIDPAWQREELAIWTPAFKIHPDHFLRLSQALTVRRSFDERLVDSACPGGECHPVNVSAAAAASCLKIVIAALMIPKKAWFPRLPQIECRMLESRLVYLPFRATGSEWEHPGERLTIMRALLEYGKNL